MHAITSPTGFVVMAACLTRRYYLFVIEKCDISKVIINLFYILNVNA